MEGLFSLRATPRVSTSICKPKFSISGTRMDVQKRNKLSVGRVRAQQVLNCIPLGFFCPSLISMLGIWVFSVFFSFFFSGLSDLIFLFMEFCFSILLLLFSCIYLYALVDSDGFY